MRVLAISGRSSEVHERRGDRGHMAGPHDLLQTRRHFADYCGPLTRRDWNSMSTTLSFHATRIQPRNRSEFKHAADCDVERKTNESVP